MEEEVEEEEEGEREDIGIGSGRKPTKEWHGVSFPGTHVDILPVCHLRVPLLP